MSETIFTIGHSNHSIPKFLELLAMNGIAAICDVRSAPFSRMNPQFNREPLQGDLQKAGIAYCFMGKELGARSEDPTVYKEHRVQFDLLEKTKLFQSGLSKVCDLGAIYRVALMCAEKDPLSCHRTILVSRSLIGKGKNVEHILADGTLESHEQALGRLLKQLHFPETDMFRTKSEIINDAYKMQSEAIAYEEKTDARSDLH